MAELTDGAIRVVVDPRGQLVAVEHTLLPFEPARTFVVTSAQAPVGRGGHVTGCRQLLVLATGRAVVHARGPQGDPLQVELDQPGTAVLLADDDHVDYWLESPGSVLLVLADRPFQDREAT